MTEVLLLALTLLSPATRPDTFDVRAELQGRYHEISQATLQFETESDVDLFHDVLRTPDWVFVDATGHTQAWSQVRLEAIHALSVPYPDSMNQPIQELSLVSDGATVVVNVTTVRTIVDAEGRYGRQGASHTLTETTPFRDTWVHVSDEWKLKSRQQISGPTVVVDKPDRGW
jgi:hypothetical protein